VSVVASFSQYWRGGGCFAGRGSFSGRPDLLGTADLFTGSLNPSSLIFRPLITSLKLTQALGSGSFNLYMTLWLSFSLIKSLTHD
jgi:hypothetical protein